MHKNNVRAARQGVWLLARILTERYYNDQWGEVAPLLLKAGQPICWCHGASGHERGAETDLRGRGRLEGAMLNVSAGLPSTRGASPAKLPRRVALASVVRVTSEQLLPC